MTRLLSRGFLPVAFLAIVLSTMAPVHADAQNLYISEFMASNSTFIADEDGAFSDWLEIHNADTVAVNLDGWFLTDLITAKTKWRIPAVTINPGQYLVVWASNKNRAVPGLPLHTNFALSAAGEYLGLIKPDGATVVSEYNPVFPSQVANVSYGHTYVGGVLQPAARRYFTIPTPGAANSEVPEDLGPTIVSVTHTPIFPADADNIVVRATIVPTGSGLGPVNLTYRVNYSTTSTTVPMFDDGLHGDGAPNDRTYGATIPPAASNPGDMVRWYVVASDAAATPNTSRSPFFPDPLTSAEYWGTVINDGVTSNLPILRYFVQDPALADTDLGTRASVFYNNKFYDNVSIEIKGQSSRSWPKKSYKFDFNGGNFMEYDPLKPKIDELNMTSNYADKSAMRTIMAWETYRDAKVPYCDTFPVHFRRNGQFYSVANFVEEPDIRYLERNNLNQLGALYKMGTDGLASNFNSINNEKKNRTWEDKTDLGVYLTGVQTAATREPYIFDNTDLPTTVNYLAATVLFHDNDHVGKNYYLYRDSDKSNEWAMLPWDKDLTFGRNYTTTGGVLNDTIWADNDNMSHPLFGDQAHPKTDGPWNKVIDALYRVPRVKEMFLRRLRTLMDSQLQAPGTDPLTLKYENRIEQLKTYLGPDLAIDHAAWPCENPWCYGTNQSVNEAADIIKNDFLPRRRNHLFNTHSAVSGLIPPSQSPGMGVFFGGVEHSPASLNQDEEYVEIQNNSPLAIDVTGWKVEGEITHTMKPGTVIPSSSSIFLSPKVQVFRARTSGPRGGQSLFVQGNYSANVSPACGPIRVKDEFGSVVASLCGCAPDLTASTLNVCAGAPVTLSTSASAAQYDWGAASATSAASIVVNPSATTTYSLVAWNTDPLLGDTMCQSARADITINVTAQSFGVGVTPTASQTISIAGSGSTLSGSITGSGTAPFAHQWGYRLVAGGPVTPLAGQTGASYTPSGAHFPGAGTYFVVDTVTSACGSPKISNEVQINVGSRTMSIGDATVLEGDSGSKTMAFTVTLSGPSTTATTVNYATADGSGPSGAVAPSDYTSRTGTLTIPAGSTSGTIAISIRGDVIFELGETFFVNLTSPSPGTTLADAQGVGTITNNEATPSVNGNSVSITEGNSGTRILTLTLTLSRASYQTVSATYATADDTALAGEDYVATSGTVTFAPGERTKTVSVTINGDTVCESNQRFRLNVTAITAGTATIGTAGTGRIVNDDCI